VLHTRTFGYANRLTVAALEDLFASLNEFRFSQRWNFFGNSDVGVSDERLAAGGLANRSDIILSPLMVRWLIRMFGYADRLTVATAPGSVRFAQQDYSLIYQIKRAPVRAPYRRLFGAPFDFLWKSPY
jgi:hypothetical protein